jgi:hypothetical protein
VENLFLKFRIVKKIKILDQKLEAIDNVKLRIEIKKQTLETYKRKTKEE